MMKRFVALMIAVLLPITAILAGCGNNTDKPVPDILISDPEITIPESVPLSIEQYYDAIKDTFHDYADAVKEIPLEECKDLKAMKKNYDLSTETCAKALEILCRFERINPPEKYAEKHKELIGEPLEREKAVIRAEWRFITSKNKADVKKNSDAYVESLDIPNEETLAAKWFDIMLELKEEPGITANNLGE